MRIRVIVAIGDRAARATEREVEACVGARAVHVEGLAAPGVVAVNARAAPRVADAAPGEGSEKTPTWRVRRGKSRMSRAGDKRYMNMIHGIGVGRKL